MHDFSRLLISASMTMGTPLAVANLLDVQPKLLYAWMAGLERPSAAHLDASKERLKRFFRIPKPEFPHPRRRAFDPRVLPALPA
jgi:hypothetical protein